MGTLEDKINALGVEKSVKEQLNALAARCEQKLGIKAVSVVERFENEVKAVRKKLPGLDEKTAMKRAFVKIKGEYKQELRSDADFFEGVVIGVNEPFDMVRRARQEAKEMWVTDKEKAIKEGYCDVDGKPLDRKETYASGASNRNFGKPLSEHSYIQNVFGLCRKQGDKDFKVFKMALGENLAGKLKVPVMVPTQFRANEATTQRDPNILSLNPYSRLAFEKMPIPEDFDVLDILSHKQLENITVELDEVPDYHGRVQNDPQRVVITQGDVQHISPDANPTTGNKMMVLDDETMGDDSMGITCWIPPHLHDVIDFGAGSRVIVVGSTVQADFQDGVNYLINVTGIYALPEYKLPPDEVPSAVVKRDMRQVR
jgi:hypothetical protein